MLCLSLAAYLGLWPAALLLPLSLALKAANPGPGQRRVPLLAALAFALFSLSLYLLSARSVRDRAWPKAAYGPRLSFSDLTPSAGLYWYLFSEMFDRFQSFFAIVLTALPYTLVAPVTYRLRRFPLAAAASLVGLFGLLEPSPTLATFAFSAAVMACDARVLARLRFVSVFCGVAMWVPVSLMFLDLHLWLQTGAGNANYFYFQQLAYSVFTGLIVLDWLRAAVNRLKAVSITEKEEAERARERKRERKEKQKEEKKRRAAVID
jgi:phosphatidylinositol glycan class U